MPTTNPSQTTPIPNSFQDSRLRLDAKLRTILGNGHSYFQPPESVKLKYPAMVYSFDGPDTSPADNVWYRFGYRFTVIHIHHDPDVEVMSEMRTEFPYSRFDRRYVSDNLYHDVYSIRFK